MPYYSTNDIINTCIEKLSELFGTRVSLKNFQTVGGGCINHASRLSTSEGEFFLKWNASAPPDMFQKEAAGLREMQQDDNSFLVIPKVIWTSEADEHPGILLMEYLQSATDTRDYDEKLGRGIARLHHKTASKFGFYHNNYCGTTVQDNSWTDDWAMFYANKRIGNLVHQIRNSRGLSGDEEKIYERLIDRIPRLLAHETVPSLIHGDLWSGNYLYTSKGPALIDPACYYADREMELGMMQLFGGFSSRTWSAYNEEFPLPEDWKERLRLYLLYHLLNHHLLFGGSYGWQAIEIAKEYL